MSVYSWDLPARGESGISGNEFRARRALAEALLEAPVGAEGTIRGAHLDQVAGGYIYTDPIATGRLAADRTVVWAELDGGHGR